MFKNKAALFRTDDSGFVYFPGYCWLPQHSNINTLKIYWAISKSIKKLSISVLTITSTKSFKICATLDPSEYLLCILIAWTFSFVVLKSLLSCSHRFEFFACVFSVFSHFFSIFLQIFNYAQQQKSFDALIKSKSTI